MAIEIQHAAEPLPPEAQAELSAAVAEYGDRAVATALGVSRHAVLAGAAGASLRRTTRQRLLSAIGAAPARALSERCGATAAARNATSDIEPDWGAVARDVAAHYRAEAAELDARGEYAEAALVREHAEWIARRAEEPRG
jgi:hypothetical protein